MLPEEWAELVPEYKDWFGIPLRLVKALYGDATAKKCWDDELSAWLIDYGFERLKAAASIFFKKQNGHKIIFSQCSG